MLSPESLVADIRRFTTLAYENELLVAHNEPGLQGTGGFRRVSWTPIPSGANFRLAVDEASTYLTWVKNGCYSAMLFDGALLQMSWDFSAGELTGHRLAYVPPPFRIDDALLMTSPVVDVIEEYFASTSVIRLMRGVLRFDYDLSAASVAHPPVHLTVNDGECRIPVVEALSFGRFARAVFKNFYSNRRGTGVVLSEFPLHRASPRRTRLSEERELHVSWLHESEQKPFLSDP